MAAIKACASCGATVGAEEVAQGLAVMAAGRLLCPQCVEHLPGDARVMINQMRALRGMASTTYRFTSVRHPGLTLFTFTTSALILNHRRRLVHGEEFATPPLPPPGSRPRLPTAAEASRGERHGWIAVVAAAVLLIVGLVWLLGGFDARPHPPEQPEVPLVIVPASTATPSPSLAPIPQMPRHALRLTELENRLRDHPREAAEIQRQAELVQDDIPVGEIVLRNRAGDLVRAAAALRPAPQPVAPVAVLPEPPVQPAPVAEPLTPVVPVQQPPEPARPVEPPPVVAKPEVKPETAPKPKPRSTPDFDPSLIPGYKPPSTTEPVAVAEEVRVEAWEPAVSWPDRAQPVVTPEGAVPAGTVQIPWPWPSGVAIWDGQQDRRSRQRRIALELSVPSITGQGGIVLAIDPRRADRTAVAAIWMDGATTAPSIQLALDRPGWQPVAIPLPGSDVALDRSRLRLRLEDLKDMPDRPFLVCGASLVRGRDPQPEDYLPELPLIAPGMVPGLGGVASRELAFRKAFAVVVRSLPERPDLSSAKILLPEVQEDSQAKFRSELRQRLLDFQKQVRRNAPEQIPDGNPGDLPTTEREILLDPRTAWMAPTMADLDQYAVAVVGFRRAEWSPDAELAASVQRLLDKLRLAQSRPRRPAQLPILAIGDIEKASPEIRAALDARWLPVAQAMVARGYPVLDLRPAMREKHVAEARRVAARLLVDGLRQLEWLAKQTR